MKVKYTLLLFVISIHMFGQWSQTDALTVSGSSYLVAATSLGNNVYAVGGMNNVFVHSPDQGETWSAPSITPPNGVFQYLRGVGDRLYASTKINTYDYELYYSLDNGMSWVLDIDGLPQNITNTGKPAMIVKDMGNGYVIAHNGQKAYYKQLGDATWIETSIDFVINDIAATSNKWLAIGIAKLLESTDNGNSWSEISTSGLPTNFQGSIMASNGVDRLYMSNAPANGGDDIYISEDGGVSWTLTNSSGFYSYSNPWVQSIFAIENYVFASIKPELANFNDPPSFIFSNTETPNFSLGNTSGLPTGITNTYLPFFFNCGNKLFTLFWDLHVTEPGFNGTLSLNNIDDKQSFNVYPNPANNEITIKTDSFQKTKAKIINIAGQEINKIQLSRNETKVDISYLLSGIYFLVLEAEESIEVIKLFKN
ncbi:T9SS type A sorting domain-containing protein [Ichthyenterobacterium magnum]|uniref:Putative secreted protein (Por secretion system target) n=1 Tax=Ichthyenterobacterium magnum TaxID=1230530 RepID=A0A420DW68_9FLAO|nr:T9SS type A sorting domain-containing protein [Ichthyenterobacterium magnum]RKE98478.1 putative secreted protein (Por secretion system target) [Ichthyenterobacterium magnum]